MAKPTDIPRWTDVTSANRIEPLSALKDSGWVPDQQPGAQNFNWLLWAIYQWILYLSALLGGAGVSENLKAAGADLVNLGVTGVASAPDWKYSTPKPRSIPAIAGLQSGTDWLIGNGVVSSVVALPGAWDVPIVVKAGETISVTANIKHATASAGILACALWRRDNAGGAPVQVANVNSGATSALQSIAVVSSHAVVANNAYWLKVVSGGISDASNLKEFFNVFVTSDTVL